jgi:hypothetical protein
MLPIRMSSFHIGGPDTRRTWNAFPARSADEQDAGPWNNSHGGAFVQPAITNGKVYVRSSAGVTVFRV